MRYINRLFTYLLLVTYFSSHNNVMRAIEKTLPAAVNKVTSSDIGQPLSAATFNIL